MNYKSICATVLAALIFGLPSVALTQTTEAYLYWTTTNDGIVSRAPVDGSYIEDVTKPLFIDVLALDVAGQRVFYGGFRTDSSNGAMYASNLAGTERQLLLELNRRLRAIALDLVSGKIYWLEQTGLSNGQIRKADLDGSNAELLVSGVRFSETLLLDLSSMKMYWATPDGLHRSDLDGSDIEVLDPIVNVRDMVLDTTNSMIYVSSSSGLHLCNLDISVCNTLVVSATRGVQLDGETVYFQLNDDGSIWTMDLDGSNQQQLTSGLHRTTRFRLDAVNDHYYFPDQSMFRSNLDGSNQVPLIGGVGKEVHDVAVSPGNDRFYVSDPSLESIISSPIDPVLTNSVFPGNEANEIGSVRGIALDETNQRLYLAVWDNAPNGGVWRVDLAGPTRTKIADGLEQTHDVAYDPVDDKIYWITDLSDTSDPTGRIQRSDFDGSNVEDVITGITDLSRGLALDTTNRKVYWTEMDNPRIMRANLDGTMQESIWNTKGPIHDVAVDPAGGKIYWVENIDDEDDTRAAIRMANLDGTSQSILIPNLSQRTRDITVVYHNSLLRLKDGFED